MMPTRVDWSGAEDAHAGPLAEWTGRAVQLLLVSVSLSVPAWALEAPSRSLQDLLLERVARRGAGSSVNGPQTEVNAPAAVVRSATYQLRVADDVWRRDAFEYRGMAVLDGRYLDFAYGGDDFVTYAFEAPEVRYGGRVSLMAVAEADPGDLVLQVSPDNETWTTVGSVDVNGHYGAVLEPMDSDRAYLRLDGRQGDGVVIDQFTVSFYTAAQAQPPEEPTPAPPTEGEQEAEQGELGYVPAHRGTAGLDEEARKRSITRGRRVDPSAPESGITRGSRVRFNE